MRVVLICYSSGQFLVKRPHLQFQTLCRVDAHVSHVHFFRVQHPLIDEEYPCSGKSGVGGISQLTHSGVVNKASDEQHEAQGQEHPPQPVLSVKVTREVGRKPDDKDPFDERQAEAGDGPVSAGG